MDRRQRQMCIRDRREGVPFPAFVEALIMEIMFELVREAGIRLPRVIGPAISIVGVLVLGDAAIRAGLVSPILSLIHISEPTRLLSISYADFCLKKKT